MEPALNATPSREVASSIVTMTRLFGVIALSLRPASQVPVVAIRPVLLSTFLDREHEAADGVLRLRAHQGIILAPVET